MTTPEMPLDLSLQAAMADYSAQEDLHALGNAAIARGLILGHGYHGGQYEILRRGEVVTLEPAAATAYLVSLLTAADGERARAEDG